MRHVQLWHGSYRVRKPIPKALQAVVRPGQYLTLAIAGERPTVHTTARAVAVSNKVFISDLTRLMQG